MEYVDSPNKRQKHPHYEHRTQKLDYKDNHFSSKKFQQVRRKASTPKKLLKSFGRIGMCLNGKSTESINVEGLDHVCFVLVNDYENDKDKYLGAGPLNDGYLIALKEKRLGFKIFYFHNPRSDEFTSFLGFFVKNTSKALTVFYSGRDSMTSGTHGVEFDQGSLSTGVIGDIISQNCNRKAHVMFITDCCNGGSVFEIDTVDPNTNLTPSNYLSFYVKKTASPESKECRRSHGIFTYYFCKFITENPSITPNRLIDRMNVSLKRFGETLACTISEPKLAESPIFFS